MTEAGFITAVAIVGAASIGVNIVLALDWLIQHRGQWHVCPFDLACWREWWEFGAPMRIHVGADARRHGGRFWEIPGFGWRDRYLWEDAEPVEVTVKPRLSSIISIRLTADEHERLRAVAERENVGYTELIRDWVRQRLTREAAAELPSPPATPDLVTWTCPHLSTSGPVVAMRCATCGPLSPVSVTYRVAS